MVHKGGMEIPYLKALLDSISQFSLLSSNDGLKCELAQKYLKETDELLKSLMPVVDEFTVSKIALVEDLEKLLDELRDSINEAKDFFESWAQMASKVYSVLQVEPLMTKIQGNVLAFCNQISPLFQSLEVNPCSDIVEKIQSKCYEQTSDVINIAMAYQMKNDIPRSEHLMKIADSLSLSSNLKLLMEVVALDMLKTKIANSENNREVSYIDRMIALISHMHTSFVKENQMQSINEIPIPPDFCCPLSLELMFDPVIVASGQTYERVFIRKWLDQGFTICPKTRQTLGHTNLIPNYTVKAFIVNWCETNNITVADPTNSVNLNKPIKFSTQADHNPDAPHSDNSMQSRHTRSPKSDRSEVNLTEDAFSSIRFEKGFQLNEKSTSSLVTSQFPNGSAAHFGRSPADISSGKNESSPERQDPNFEDQIFNQSKESSSSNTLQGEGGTSSYGPSVQMQDSDDNSGEIIQEEPGSSVPLRNQTLWQHPSGRFGPRIMSLSSSEARSNISEIETQVRQLIEGLKSDSVDALKAATAELRLLTKSNTENRVVIADCGAIPQLVTLLHSSDWAIQENAVTALLNLSLNGNNKTAIANADAIESLVQVLKTGNSEAKQNAAATIFSLSLIDENKVKIGRSGAIGPLVELLSSGTPGGKKDAAIALYNLSLSHENKARILQDGAVRHLVDLMDPAAGLVDKAVAVLANLSSIPEGRSAIGSEGAIPVLVEVVELGSSRAKENAAAALLQLCINSSKFSRMALQEGVIPPLIALSKSGTARAKEKAQGLLTHFRSRYGKGARA